MSSPNSERRLKQSLKNARVAIFMNVVLLLLAFYSRKIFIDTLGTSVTGMNSTITDMLGLLNLAELGVLTAVAYSLYKPLFDGDRTKIEQIMSLLGYLYRIIGAVILALGVILSLFLPMIYGDKGVDMGLLFMGFYTFLTVNLLGYFFNYKQNLLVADHRNYVIVSTTGLIQIVKILLQILFLKYVGEGLYVKYFEFLAIEIVFSTAYTLIINRRVKRFYPWLNSSYAMGHRVRRDFPEVFTKIKQVFSHKFGSVVLTQTDSIVISILTTWSVVTYYTNYQLIFLRLTRLVFASFDNLNAGIGNLVAEGDKRRVIATYHQLNALFYWVAGTIVISGYVLTKPFILIWLKDAEFILPHGVFLLIMANLYISIIRRPQDIFLSAHGIFHDTWAPWVEALTNLLVSVGLGWFFGLSGILVGTLISTLSVAILWKPYLLFREAFELRVRQYWRDSLLFMAITVVVGTLILFINRYIPVVDNYLSWCLLALAVTGLTALALGGMMYALSSGMRGVSRRLVGQFIDRIRKK